MSDTKTATSTTPTNSTQPTGQPIVKPAEVATSQSQQTASTNGVPIVKP